MRLFSPAKINLFFRVLSRRQDGFHEIASAYQSITLGDYLSCSIADQDSFFCSNLDVPKDDSNLIIKAIDLFRKKTGLKTCFEISLEKNIPMQSGLGGGSSNAATALWAANELCGKPLNLESLMKLSSQIGSDVPFFFSYGSAYCKGRGEEIEFQDPFPNKQIWIVKPKESLLTKEVYAKVDTSELSFVCPNAALSNWKKGIPEFCNDLEPAALKILPSLLELKKVFTENGFKIAMTGSGTAFFCLGNGDLPKLPEGSLVFKVNFIRRKRDCWYEEIL